VSRWSLNLPYRSRSAPIHEILGCARRLDPAERQTTRELVHLLQLERGCSTVDDALAVVGRSKPAERRAMLDHARARAGLESTHAVEGRERVEQESRSALRRMAEDSRPLRLGFSASGAGFVDLDEQAAEAARAGTEERSRRARREAREAERRAEAAEHDAHERAWRARLLRELPPGIVG
jgi:hypothetical protein